MQIRRRRKPLPPPHYSTHLLKRMDGTWYGEIRIDAGTGCILARSEGKRRADVVRSLRRQFTAAWEDIDLLRAIPFEEVIEHSLIYSDGQRFLPTKRNG